MFLLALHSLCISSYAADTTWAPDPLVITVEERAELERKGDKGLLAGAPASTYFVIVPDNNNGRFYVERDGLLRFRAPAEAGLHKASFDIRDSANPDFKSRADVVIEVVATDDAPQALDYEFALSEANSVIAKLDVGALDDYKQFPNTPPPTVALKGAPNGATLTSDGAFTFQADPKFSGVARLTYEVTDARGQKGTGFIVVYSKFYGAPPVIAPGGALTLQEEGSATIDLRKLVTDPDPGDQDALRFSVPENQRPTLGILKPDPITSGLYTYSPDPNQHGADKFSFTVTDGRYSRTAEYGIVVTPVPDKPVGEDIQVTWDPVLKELVVINLIDHAKASDPDKDALRISRDPDLSKLPLGVTGRLAGLQLFLDFDPNTYSGQAFDLDYVLTDGQLESEPISIKVTTKQPAVTGTGWCADYKSKYQEYAEDLFVCLDASQDGPRIRPASDSFLQPPYRSGQRLLVLVRHDVGARPTVSVASDGTPKKPAESQAVSDDGVISGFLFRPDSPRYQIVVNVRVGENSDAADKTREVVVPVLWSLLPKPSEPHILLPSIGETGEPFRIVPDAKLTAIADATQTQLTTDLFGMDVLWGHLALKLSAAIDTVAEGEDETTTTELNFLTIDPALEPDAAFRAFAEGGGLYYLFPLAANDWGQRTLGDDFVRLFNVNIGARVPIDPSRGVNLDDWVPFGDFFLDGHLVWTGSELGLPSASVVLNARAGVAPLSKDLAKQMLGKGSEQLLGYMSIGVGIGATQGPKFGIDLHVAPAVGTIEPSFVLTYGK